MRAMLLARFVACSSLFFFNLTFAAEPLILEEARLVPSDPSPPGFGSSVAIDGDVAVVGATDGGGMPEHGRPGAAYVFERQSNGVWQQVAKLLPLHEEPQGTGSSNLGTSVAIEGNVIVVGTYFSPQTTVFERINGVWTRAAVLDTSAVDVDIRDGTIITSYTWGAHLYRRGATGWTRVQDLVNGQPQPDADYLGRGVAISSIAAFHGSYGNEDEINPSAPSTLYIYPLGPNRLWTGAPPTAIPDPSGTQAPSSFTASIEASGSRALVSGFPETYIFERNARGEWNVAQTLAGAIDIDGDTILGASASQGLGIYRHTSAGWTRKASLASSVREPLGSLELRGNRVIAGGNWTVPRPTGAVAYVFDIPNQLAPNPPMLHENFEDGAANGWVAQPNSTFSVASVGGSRVYRQTNVTTGAASIYPTADWDRQSIQADVTPRSYAAPPGDRWFGLMVRYIDANNYYYITVRNSNTIQLKRIVNGVVTTLGSAALSVALHRNYALRLEAHGEQLRAFVEGRLVLTARDSSLTRGRPGIAMYRTRADYDNVILNPDPSVILKDERFNTPTIQMDWDWVNYAYQWVKLPDATVFTQPTTGGGAYVFSYYSHGTDQIIRARLRATQFNGADRWIGLIGRYVDAQNYYYLTLRNSNQISLRKLTNGVITTLDTSATPPVTVNTWYDLRLDIVGTTLRAYMNGVLMLEATDQTAPHPAGPAGVAAYKTAAEADDFLVVQP
ncbi:MAG TPA: hypothetical protein VGD45_28080 [Steroidobacter sp.]|uniref:hypothetical protein n=1 Tax=Steroidobacter sp. TaxID=1978227 RepID=UPI002EDB4AA1